MPSDDLADHLVGQGVVAGVEPAAANVPVEPLELAAPEHPAAAGDVERDVDDALGRLDRPPLHREHLRAPVLTVVDTRQPVVDEPVDGRLSGIQLEVHLRHLVLHHRVVGVGAALDADRRLAPCAESTASSSARSAIPR